MSQKNLVVHQLRIEKIRLFRTLWGVIKKEEVELNNDFNTARNMACSEWKFVDAVVGTSPVKMLPEQMKLLRRNFHLLQEEISRRKYFLIRAFWATLKVCGVPLSDEQRSCYEYWKKELAKDEPNLTDRFADAADKG